ncbi:MAG: peptidoglycan-associated lipoprotein Pal [Alphaproteobacteria bacterium]|nr:peptidoglycan-associated lipoprotein Pal [Alphaproteobacteria bacterium]
MKKSVVLLFCAALLTSCATSSKDSGSESEVLSDAQWRDVDITDLQETQLGAQFKKTTQPIVYFQLNSAFLEPEALSVLNDQIAWFQANPAAKIVIEGHCDERGTREYNLALGERRASTIRDYFVANGIASSRIRIISYGKERPEVLGSTELAWSKNRRGVTIAY